ncbi:ATP-binding protein [Defluviimonas salinarum]|uniref:ATP-binding protein n=1 Tax=Defluviimonas salinarum TaxID=2992147 RepID=A0ABT3JB82_9RHOB|nr:ATP-binding protein [Defluviimonas salinarum]MCW3784704.1 ATP-binding protein [Defluviimonas salinarum]
MTTASSFRGLQIEHARFHTATTELRERIELARAAGGGIIPLLGPTRCGKTDLITHLCGTLGVQVRGPNSMIQTCSFASGIVPPKPNDQDLYRAMLAALGYGYHKHEKIVGLRERLITKISDEGREVLFLDECSHCAEPGANLSARAATDHFKSLVDASGIVLVLAGLPKLQKLLDGNEQLRDRAMRTVELNPYQWSVDSDREGFLGAIFPLMEAFCDAGHSLEIDEVDLARRLYGASGGRVGRAVEFLNHGLTMYGDKREIGLEDFARIAKATLQIQANLPDMFAETPPTDGELERSYVTVMQEAGLPVRPVRIETYGALRSIGAS